IDAGKGTSIYDTTLVTGAQTMWAAGYTGAGVDVAIIDSGVTPVAGLDAPGKVVDGPDFSADPADSPSIDGFGHGTHMAGIIAGRDEGATAGAYAGDATNFIGMAPDARLVNIKAADGTGATD